MRIIGLLGGVASGKSSVAQHFARLGAGILDADRAGHDVLRLPQIEWAIRQRWGEAVLGPDGQINRGKVAAIVFSDPPKGPQERRFLEDLTHCQIGRMLQQEAAGMVARGYTLAVLDAPLLLEAGWDRFCDMLVFVDAPCNERLRRALARGWTEREFAAREAAQKSLQQKRQRAHAIIDNSGSLQQTQAQVERVWESLLVKERPLG